MATQNQEQTQGSLQQGQQQNQQQRNDNRNQAEQRQTVPRQLGQDDNRKNTPGSPQEPNRQIGDKPPQNEQGDPRQLQLENERNRQQGHDQAKSPTKAAQQGGVTSDQDDTTLGSSSDQL